MSPRQEVQECADLFKRQAIIKRASVLNQLGHGRIERLKRVLNDRRSSHALDDRHADGSIDEQTG